MYIYKLHEVDQTKHEIFCVHIVCNEIQVKVNLEITTFFFYLRFPYCPNFFRVQWCMGKKRGGGRRERVELPDSLMYEAVCNRATL